MMRGLTEMGSCFFDRRNFKKIPLSQTQMDMVVHLKIHPNSPKILVTYDSLGEVLNCLEYHGKLSKFTIVVDEFTSLFTDALMKGDAEFKLVNRVSALPNRVIYISATPIDEQYLDQIPEFANLPYVTFNWDASCIEKVTIKSRR